MEMCCWEDQTQGIGEIISIGLVEMCLDTGKMLRKAEHIVQPQIHQVSDFCTRLTGITQKRVDTEGRPLKNVMDGIQAKFGGAKKLYVAWGADGEYLARQCRIKGFESPIKSQINAQLLYMAKLRHNGGQISLVKAMDRHGLTFEGRQHSALADANNLAKLVHATSLLG
jgi:inhibitor of KinA sporulation pathway (predicted exonuclease)